jgi:hypothetical protein
MALKKNNDVRRPEPDIGVTVADDSGTRHVIVT